MPKPEAVLNQLTFGNTYDAAPKASANNPNIVFFSRQEYGHSSIWSYNRENNLFTNYSNGCTPEPIKNEPDAFLCTRFNDKGIGEIWKINYQTGIETLILSHSRALRPVSHPTDNGLCVWATVSIPTTNASKTSTSL